MAALASRRVSGVAVAAAVALLSACSTMGDVADAMDPTGWFGSSTPKSPPPRAAQANSAPSNLGAVPARPQPQSTAAERRAVESSLAADRNNALYADEQLRGRPAAPPPPTSAVAARPAAPPASATSPAPAPQAAAAPPPAAPAPAAPPPAQRVPSPAAVAAATPERPAGPVSNASRAIPSIVQSTPTPPAAAVAAPAPAPAPAPPPQVAAVAAPPPVAPPAAAVAPQRPLSVEEVFRQQLEQSSRRSVAAVAAAPQPAAVARAAAQPAATALAGGGSLGSPTLIPAQPVAATAPTSEQRPAATAFAAGAAGRLATLRFASGSARLAEADLAAIRQSADSIRSTGARTRVVGYAPPDGRGGATEQRRLADFNLSLDRAEAVARELVRLGVQPGQIMVEGRADSSAAAGGPRAEIFLEN